MEKRIKIIDEFYDGFREDMRLSARKSGQLEFLTTMHYIHKLMPSGTEILELGAGTGRYSIALAKEGYSVTAVELAAKNFELLQKNCRGINKVMPVQGDALDLRLFGDNAFDMTLLLGPMYHLYDKNEQLKALSEAVRVTKSGGIIMAAFLSVHAIMYNDYLQGNTRHGIDENFTEDYLVKHFPEQIFTGFNMDEFENLFDNLPVRYITTVATDGILELAQGRSDFCMSDEDFAAFAEYHLKHCERRELLGSSSHLLYICSKN